MSTVRAKPSREIPVQPGGRLAAPGALGLVQSFINSHYDLEHEHGADLFATPSSLSTWLCGHRLLDPSSARVSQRDHRRAVAVREALRALARRNGSPESPAEDLLAELNEAAAGAAVEVRFGQDGPQFVASGRGGVGGTVGLVLAICATAMIDGSWSRLKVCPGEDCGWAFYDHSRNQSGRWCSMAVCGGRAKARAHYRRRRSGEG
jgi:predicted RNA-binding Zn ribbon-like protein